MFPDLSKDGKAFKLWSERAKEMQRQLPNTSFTVSDLLERLAPEQDKEQGNDLADFLIKQDWRLFKKQDIKEAPQPEPVKAIALEKSKIPKKSILKNEESISHVEARTIQSTTNWDNEITELEKFFKNTTITLPIKLQQSTVVPRVCFIEGHLATLKAHNGNRAFLSYLHRLKELKYVLHHQTHLLNKIT